MSGIPVYSNSPINASTASGTTPQTAGPLAQTSSAAPAPAPATTTASASTESYPPARPGAAAVPAPTASARSYAPVQPTPTTKIDQGNPPPPQPGAFPNLPNRSNLPPPPKAGEYQPSQQTSTAQAYPPQMFIPPPTTAHGAQPPASTTRTTTTASYAYPAPIAGDYGAQKQSFEHPPGYQQNVYAADLTADQRRVHGNNSTGQNTYNGPEKSKDADSDGVWSATTKWAQTATQKISDVHDGVWEMINKK